MRKLTTRGSKDIESKKRKRNQIILGTVLVVIMLFSVFGYSFMSQENEENTSGNQIEYKGNVFIEKNSQWLLSSADRTFDFAISNNPSEIKEYVDYLEFDGLRYLNTYSGKPLYIYSSSDTGIAEADIYVNLNSLALRIRNAYPGNETAVNLSEIERKEDWPTKNCENNFIIITNSSENRVYQERGCVYISGNGEQEILKLTDKFLLEIFNLG